MSRRVSVHVDIDAFFAAIEEQGHPEYKGKPLVVGGAGDPRKRGVVSTANYEARKFGIYLGMPLRTAFKKCPQCIFLPVDFDTYVEVSERFHSIIRRFSPLVESWGLDEAFLDVTSSKKSAEEIAEKIKQRIKKELGLTCSMGIAYNKLLAKMASGMQKPDGLTIRLKPFSTHTHQHMLEEPVTSSKEILEEALRLLEEIDINRPVRLVGLKVSNLEEVKK